MKTIILDKEAPVLRQIAKSVPINQIRSPKIQSVIQKMKEALEEQEDGVAIAAPQIGESLRIFVVSHRAFSLINKNSPETFTEDLVFINPEITKVSKKKKRMEEGCLSVRWLYGQVERSEKVHVKAINENGENFERGSSGLLAQIFQHEIDHLNGILFIDKATDVEDIPPEKQNGEK
jgi:peptide deformylase